MKSRTNAALLVALITSASSVAFAQTTTAYEYDVHGRLVRSIGADGSSAYTYDNANNRTRLVMGLNHAPVASNDSASVSAGSVISIGALANDSDADGDALTIVDVVGATKGTASITNGGLNVSYTANTGASGADVLTYTIADTKGALSKASITITIGSAVAAPTVGPATTTITANTSNNPLSTSITGSAISVAVTSAPANGSTSISGTTISYTPSTNWSGVNTLSYTASNAGGTSSPAQLTVQVKPTVNPVSNVAVTYNTARSIALSPITNYSALSVAGGASKGTVTISGATATYTPNSGQTGADSFSYRATTAGVAGDPQTVSLTIGSAPLPPPVANNDSITVPYGTGITFQPMNNDSGTGLNITAATQPSVGRSAFDAGNIWVGDMGEGGFNTSLQYTITDSLGRTATATVNVTAAANPNPAPVARNDNITIPYGGSLTFQPMNNDSGTGLQIVSVSAPSIGNFAYDAGNIWYGTVGTWSGTTSMQYTIRDSSNRTSTATVYVTVQPNPNPPPVANPDQVWVPYGGAVLFQPMSNDSGNQISIQSVSTPSGVDMAHDLGNIWLGHTGWSGSGTFTYTIVDNIGQTATSTVTYIARGSGEVDP
jgi:YD repeat-containing protein